IRGHQWSKSMKTQSIEYEDGNVTLRGFVAFDDATSHQRPGVLVMPEAFGLGTHAMQRAERLASLGYVALAGDPYGNGLEVTDLQEAIKRASALREDPATFRQRARVALDTLASLPQVAASRSAAIGYCLGGTFALELARDGAPLRGVVSFHGGLETPRPAVAGQVKAKILVCTGADDPFVPVAQVNALAEEMTKAQADWRIMGKGAREHASTNPTPDRVGRPAMAKTKLGASRQGKRRVRSSEEISARR